MWLIGKTVSWAERREMPLRVRFVVTPPIFSPAAVRVARRRTAFPRKADSAPRHRLPIPSDRMIRMR